MSLASNVRMPDGTSFCEVSPTLVEIIENNGFRINQAKVKLSPRSHRQEVTGLIVNKRLNVKRRFIRQIRAMLHAWEKFGLVDAQKHFVAEHGGDNLSFESVVRGKIGFVGHVRGRPDNIFRKLAVQFNKLATGPKIRTDLTPEEIALQATWVVEHGSGKGTTFGQGTAFFLSGYGLVTCAHCVGTDAYIYHPADHTKRFPVKLRVHFRADEIGNNWGTRSALR